MSWPREYGGQERSYEEQYLFQETLNYVSAPGATRRRPVASPRYGSPTLRAHGRRRARNPVDSAAGRDRRGAGSAVASRRKMSDCSPEPTIP